MHFIWMALYFFDSLNKRLILQGWWSFFQFHLIIQYNGLLANPDGLGLAICSQVYLFFSLFICCQGSHRLEKYLNIQDCLEKSLKIKLP